MTTLSLDESRTGFLVNERPTFLLGASYYGGLGAPDDFVDRDLDELKRHGFHWIRVWATWAAFGHNVSAVTPVGQAREPYLSRLKQLCEKTDGLGLIVDVTLSRGNGVVGSGLLPGQEGHLEAVGLLAEELKPFRNVYFDLGNERNMGKGRHVAFDELSVLRERVGELDPGRLVTASQAGDITGQELRDYLMVAKVDFISPHRPRRAGSPEQTAERTREYFRRMQELGRLVPIHYQEPMRRGFGTWQPEARDFFADLRNAEVGGAAGWCFHNGDERSQPDRRPRRSFDMRREEGRLFEQLEVLERTVVEKASSALARGERGDTRAKGPEC